MIDFKAYFSEAYRIGNAELKDTVDIDSDTFTDRFVFERDHDRWLDVVFNIYSDPHTVEYLKQEMTRGGSPTIPSFDKYSTIDWYVKGYVRSVDKNREKYGSRMNSIFTNIIYSLKYFASTRQINTFLYECNVERGRIYKSVLERNADKIDILYIDKSNTWGVFQVK